MAGPTVTRIHSLAAVLMILGGIAHIIATFFFPDRNGLEAVWLSGAGLAFCYLGLFNLAVARLPAAPTALRAGLHLSNIAMLVFAVLLTLYAPLAPQLYVLILTALALTLSSATRAASSHGDGGDLA